ncbi:MAG: hypothetical protein GTN80_11880 [Nitrososphaeria archaeon]|nr:hypothetical protein [Nitrososphaeria archaeon]NIQ34316.1 hypothetical protein [Nitrososphaeria archaeon]
MRDWLIKVGYKEGLDGARKAGKPIPDPPKIPKNLVEELSRRYVYAYEKLTGCKL